LNIRELTHSRLEIRKVVILATSHVRLAVEDILSILIHIIIDFPASRPGSSRSGTALGREFLLSSAADGALGSHC